MSLLCNNMEVEEPFKLGFLFTPPQSFLRKSWVKRFCALYNASSHGIQRLEIFDNDTAFLKQSKSPSKIVPLTDCVKVTPSPQKQQANVFEVRTKSCSHQFSADSFNEMTEWLTALQTVSFGPIFNSALNTTQNVLQDIKQEENMLYSSMDEPEMYSVKSLNTDAMIRNNLHGDYKLIVTSVGISIAEDKFQNKVGKAILTWLYRHIRRYGCSKDNFSFEAGRKCPSGEGLFAFSSSDGSLIFQSVDSHVASLKLSQSDGDAPLSPVCDDDKGSVFLFKNDIQKPKLNHDAIPLNASRSSVSYDKASNKTEIIKLERDKCIAKPTHPVSKPPRKSKINAYVNVHHSENETSHPFKLSNQTDNINNSQNVYEDPIDHEFCATNQLSRSNETSVLTMCEPVYAVLEAEPSSNTFNMKFIDEKMKNINFIDKTVLDGAQNSTECSFKNRQPNKESDCYDHLSLKKYDNRYAARNSSSDHIYGKLLASRPTSTMSKPSIGQKHNSLKMIKKDTVGVNSACNHGHSYTNMEIKDVQQYESVDVEPKHILQNDAEYARVNKNRK